MKYPNTCFAMLALAAMAPAGLTTASAQGAASREPVVITPPAVHDGSNWSRAPFPAARPENDVTPPSGQAINPSLPPNTPATDTETRPLPEPRVAIFQSAQPPLAEPGLTPTGRPSVSAAAALDAAQMATALSTADYTTRSQVLADVESHLKATDEAMRTIRGSMSQMSASSRDQFKAAQDQAKRAERTVRDSLAAARSASRDNWESARAKLTADFQAYASALASIDALTGVQPVR